MAGLYLMVNLGLPKGFPHPKALATVHLGLLPLAMQYAFGRAGQLPRDKKEAQPPPQP